MRYPHDFHMIGGHLHCERVRVSRIAESVGTPLYIYSYKTLFEHLIKLEAAFSSVRPLICFSVKANGNLAILKLLVSRGAGLDIVSAGELYKARKVGCPGSRIVYASVGKHSDEIRAALAAGIFCFNVESEPELLAIDSIARSMKLVAPVALRLNPNVRARTHRYITTGVAETKFGIDRRGVLELLRRRSEFRGVRFLGIHLHIGSQITQALPFVQAIRRAADVIKQARGYGAKIDWLNLGGGLGIIYKDEQPQTPKEFASAVMPLIKPLNVRLILEPGRFIVGNAGVLVTEVLYLKLKRSRGKNFAVIDAGMNDLIRPALYGAYHEVVKVRGTQGSQDKTLRYDVVGPVCESADVFARDKRLGRLKAHDLLAILGAGAYGSTMSSNYNGRLRAAEVLVRGRRWAVIRRRETMRDLIRHDVIPTLALS